MYDIYGMQSHMPYIMAFMTYLQQLTFTMEMREYSVALVTCL